MASLRRALLLFVCAATAGASIVGYLVLGGTASRLIVDAALLLSLALIVWFTLTPSVTRVEQMVEVLRALARGDRHQRVNAEEFAGLADIARGVNEVAASLTEHEDTNLGPVQARPRLNTRPTHVVKPGEGSDLGQVRVHKRSEPAAPTEKPRERTREPQAPARADSAPPKGAAPSERSTPPSDPPARAAEAKAEPKEEPKPAARAETGAGIVSRPELDPDAFEPAPGGAVPSAVRSAALSGDVGEPRKRSRARSILAPPAGSEPSGPVDVERPAVAAPSNDTAIDPAPGSAEAGSNGSQAPLSVMPSRAELEVLFSEFVTAKKGKDESVSDLDLEAFTQTIQGECERLLQAHSCKGVRFEVTEQDGEVSLRPRLIR